MEDFNRFYTAESVTEGHPDKLCDIIADSILDAHIAKDPKSRVACEVLATRGHIVIAGEITCSEHVDIADVVIGVLQNVGYNPKDFVIEMHLHKQSIDIAAGVDTSLEIRRGVGDGLDLLGAGDQGVMIGFACDETIEYLPLPVVLARKITQSLTAAYKSGYINGIKADGKAQVTVEYANGVPVRIDAVVVSIQHEESKQLDELEYEIQEKVLAYALKQFPPDENTRVLINPSGRFVDGGPSADTGLTGRKLMIDTYGSFAPHGGGAFSGKDGTKVDRSGAYMARYLAKNIVGGGLAKRCQVTLAYAIGVSQPVMVQIDTLGTGSICADDCLAIAVKELFDLSPEGMIDVLQLYTPIFTKTAIYGHFGNANFPWEKLNRTAVIRNAVI